MAESRRGRPRDPDSDRAILEAALRLLASEGYARMSMERVAAEAGVSKPTIYLRYDSKEDLAIAAVSYLRLGQAPQGTGNLRADLIRYMRHFRRSFEEMWAMSVLGTALVEEHRAPKLLQMWRERTAGPYRRLLREVLEQAREQGEIEAETEPDTAIDMLLGAYYARYLSGAPFPADWPETLVDAVIRSLRKPANQ